MLDLGLSVVATKVEFGLVWCNRLSVEMGSSALSSVKGVAVVDDGAGSPPRLDLLPPGVVSESALLISKLIWA